MRFGIPLSGAVFPSTAAESFSRVSFLSVATGVGHSKFEFVHLVCSVRLT